MCLKDSVPLYLYDLLNNLQASTIIDISNEDNITFIRNPHNLLLQDIIF